MKAADPRIGAAFSAAAATYEQAAGVQARVAAGLAARLDTLPPLPAAPRVVEIGCGTGLLTRRLAARLGPGARILATDLSAPMIARARAALGADPRLAFAVMDGEAPALAPASCDLIVSSLAVQWFGDLGRALGGFARALAPGGALLVTTLGAGTFAEWRAAHQALGVEPGLRPFPTAQALGGMAPAGGTTRISCERIDEHYANGLAFARGLAATGAVVPRPGHRPLPSGTLRRIIQHLGAPCTLGWDVLTLTFLKNASER